MCFFARSALLWLAAASGKLKINSQHSAFVEGTPHCTPTDGWLLRRDGCGPWRTTEYFFSRMQGRFAGAG
jgi:hypothetical protein